MTSKPRLRSQLWFDNPDNPGMTALYLERYLNYGLTKDELCAGKPIIGIAQTGSDLSPCNRHHIELAKRVRDGIRDAGGIAFEFPVHPIQETGKRPTAALDRNLAYLGLVEVLYGYPLDGVVLLTGCDKTTPACLMAAATVNLPAIVLSGGPMLNGWWKGERSGSGTAVWNARQAHAAGRIDYAEFIDIVASSAPSIGHCNTMGTASTMNALAEALGMSLPGCAAIPAPYRERAQIAYQTGLRAVAIVREDLKPSDILTRKAFENAIMACSAIGGSTNAPIHINAIARHVGVKLGIVDWEKVGLDIPLLVDMQPAGKYLGEEFHRAGAQGLQPHLFIAMPGDKDDWELSACRCELALEFKTALPRQSHVQHQAAWSVWTPAAQEILRLRKRLGSQAHRFKQTLDRRSHTGIIINDEYRGSACGRHSCASTLLGSVK